jgi:arylsulfatase A-like enzyme
LLTGYNHHSNNAGSIMETATAFPGNNGVRPQSITPMAEVLRQNGFSTAAFGKYHETPPWEISAAAHTIVGRRTQASRSFTASSVGKRTSMRR